MPRPREFEPEEVVAKSMELFWRQGYQGTSLQDLVDETGVNRASLYATFSDKHNLFLRALSHYRTTVVPERLVLLDEGSGGVAAIRTYFEAVVDDLGGMALGKGCLMVNSAIELAPTDAQVALEVGRHLERLRSSFAVALGRAVEAGEIESSTRIPALSRFLTGVAQGLMVVGKVSPEPAPLRDLYEPALGSLR